MLAISSKNNPRRAVPFAQSTQLDNFDRSEEKAFVCSPSKRNPRKVDLIVQQLAPYLPGNFHWLVSLWSANELVHNAGEQVTHVLAEIPPIDRDGCRFSWHEDSATFPQMWASVHQFLAWRTTACYTEQYGGDSLVWLTLVASRQNSNGWWVIQATNDAKFYYVTKHSSYWCLCPNFSFYPLGCFGFIQLEGTRYMAKRSILSKADALLLLRKFAGCWLAISDTLAS